VEIEGERPEDVSIARGATNAAFVGGALIVPHQWSAPDLFGRAEGYGGGGGETTPIVAGLALIAPDVFDDVTVEGLQQARGIAWDARADRIFVTGYGDDRVIAFDEASKASIHLAWAPSALVADCGPSAVTVADDGAALVWCELARRVAVLTPRADEPPDVTLSPAVADSRLDASARRGRALFRRGDPAISARGAIACASCHPEGLADGLTWRIGEFVFQTPILAGRLAGTAPYKWDGHDPTLAASIDETIEQRLGGTGIPAADERDLEAYLLSLPPPRAPAGGEAATRGKLAFDKAGCATCHDGPRLTDRLLHGGLDTEPRRVDTPSLIGLSASAPYFHNGDAPTLRDAVLNKIGMGDASSLSPAEIDDLVAYLGTL
jgi:hypothetical protein